MGSHVHLKLVIWRVGKNQSTWIFIKNVLTGGGGVSHTFFWRGEGLIYINHCKDYTNHSYVKDKSLSLRALDMAETNQNGIFFLSGVKLT